MMKKWLGQLCVDLNPITDLVCGPLFSLCVFCVQISVDCSELKYKMHSHSAPTHYAIHFSFKSSCSCTIIPFA